MNVQTESSREKLGRKPADMPDRGGPKPNAQITASTVPLNRAENPVAAFGAKPGMGAVQCESSECDLSRTANSPYDKEQLSATKPQVSFKGKRG
jgi:type V secretory pathway adhesin AidA